MAWHHASRPAGAMLPYMFAALTMISVGKAAAEIICEVRDQFHNRPDLVAADGKTTLRDCIMMASNGEKIPPEMDVAPDSNKCVEISTRSSVREMVAPGAYAILAPLFVGFLVGPRFLLGMLAGAVGSGCMLAIMMANAGGAWDNSKKLCEKLGLKKSSNPKEQQQQKACVVGDTVGDPFKDTSGPALNILLKLMSMVSLTVAPLLKPADPKGRKKGMMVDCDGVVISVWPQCDNQAVDADAIIVAVLSRRALKFDFRPGAGNNNKVCIEEALAGRAGAAGLRLLREDRGRRLCDGGRDRVEEVLG